MMVVTLEAARGDRGDLSSEITQRPARSDRSTGSTTATPSEPSGRRPADPRPPAPQRMSPRPGDRHRGRTEQKEKVTRIPNIALAAAVAGMIACVGSPALGADEEHPKTAAELGLMQGFPPAPAKLVTLANWQGEPYNRWSLQHVSEVIPSARIGRSNGIAELETVLQSVDAVTFAAVDGKRKTVADMLVDTYTDGFLVLHNGKIVAERYFNAMGPASLHLLHGITQSYIGTLAGLPITRGQLDVDKPVTDYIPELKGTGFDGATVRQVLDMRTGVTFGEDPTDPTAESSVMEISIGWRPRGYSDAPASAYDFIETLTQKDSDHGKKFEYRSAHTYVLAWLIETVTETRLQDYFATELWAKLGAEYDAAFTVDPHGTPAAGAGLNTTLRDAARFGQMHLQGGFFNGQQVIPTEWITDCRQGDEGARGAYVGSEYARLFPKGIYRNHWWVKDPSKGIYVAVGRYGQIMYINVPANLVVVKLSSYPKADDHNVIVDHVRAFDAIAENLSKE